MNAERREWLESIGFVWNSPDANPPPIAWEIVQATLTTYQTEHGHLNVPHKFEVPSCAPWDARVWGRKFGNIVHRLRRAKKSMKAERREWLESAGFQWVFAQGRRSAAPRDTEWEIVKSALTVYKNKHGNLLVPRNFEVPQSDPWPQETRGTKLGIAVKGIRGRDQFLKSESEPERRVWLESMGFVWQVRARRRVVQVPEEEGIPDAGPR
jgi:hypothetical protein